MSDRTDRANLAESPAPEVATQPAPPSSFWLWVLCLLGVDYFSTLAYQPSISFQVAGRLAPLATVAVVVLTLFGALPVYFYVAGKSAHGQGSIALLERLVHGWRGKTAILMLLGFAATDFVMIKTISLADAAEHVIHNTCISEDKPLHALALEARAWSREHFGERFTDFCNEQLVVTILLGIVGFVFWFLLRKGFNRKVLGLSVPLVGTYLLLNGLVIGGGVCYLLQHPERLQTWLEQVQRGDWNISGPVWVDPGWGVIALLCLLYLPQLALGLSGFEMSLILMPQVRGQAGDDPRDPRGRIRNTRKMLLVAALIMAVYLLGSVLVTTTLIPPEAYAKKGLAENRALAYLAHGGGVARGPGPELLAPFCGPVLGSIYDVVSVLILILAGTSVMTALATLMPQFLLRFGMELKWAHKWGLLLVLFALVNLAVTVYFRADVSDQRGAYATGVLVLMASASVVTAITRKHHERRWLFSFPWVYGLIALVFAAMAVVVMITAPSGLLIAFCFILTILASSVFARAIRSDELRTLGFDFVDEKAKFLWDSLRQADFPALVPHRPGRHERVLKEQTIRQDHQLDPDVDIVFLEVEVDDPSNFYQRLLIDVFREEKRIVIKVTRCVSVAHAIAAIALEMSKESKAPGVHFGWSELELLAASWSYFAFGEGNIPWKVRELIHTAEPNPGRRPRVIIG